MDIHCTYCGNTNFVSASIGEVSSLDGCMFVPTVNIYSCTNCGHIEMFDRHLDKFALEKKVEEERKLQKEQEKRIAEMQAIEREIERLTAIINNENSTVKEVKEAAKIVNELNKKLGKASFEEYHVQAGISKNIDSFY